MQRPLIYLLNKLPKKLVSGLLGLDNFNYTKINKITDNAIDYVDDNGKYKIRAYQNKQFAIIDKIKKNILSLSLALINPVAGLFIADTDTTSTNDGDQYIRKNAGTTNYGAQTYMYVERTDPGGDYYDSLIKFTLPSGSGTITEIKLYLYQYEVQGGGGSVNCGEITTSWDESTVTWNTAPEMGTGLGTIDLTSVGWHSINLTSLAKDWEDVVGVRIGDTGGVLTSGQFQKLYTKENGTNVPYIEITYTPPETTETIDKGLVYTIQITDTIDLGLVYSVIAGHTDDLDLDYRVWTTDELSIGLGYEIRQAGYSREDASSLPADDTNLTNAFTQTEYENVVSDDDVFVEQEAEDNAVFLWKDRNVNDTDLIKGYWKGKSDLAPSSSTVYLQVYNRDSAEWETIDSDNATAADTEFVLTGEITADLSDYYDANNWVAFRVYQSNS